MCKSSVSRGGERDILLVDDDVHQFFVERDVHSCRVFSQEVKQDIARVVQEEPDRVE